MAVSIAHIGSSVARRLGRAFVHGARQRPWVLTIWGVTLTFLAIAIATSVHIGIPIRDPEGTLLGKKIVAPFLFMVLFIGLDVARRARPRWKSGEQRPLSAMRDVFLGRWRIQRIVLALMGFMAFHVTYLSYRNLKSFVALFDPQSYDPQLVQLDRWMALGHSPGPLLHDLLGTHISAFVLSAIYLAFIPLVPISVAAALTFTTRMREGYLFVAASVYCWILGTASYFMIPSLGPFEGASWQFDGLTRSGVTQVQQALIDHRLDLLHDPLGYPGVASIGGFASLHVGIVFMVYLMARHYQARVLATATMAFLIPTVIATIYFGWHYIVDDIAGFGIGWFAVVAARWTIYPELSPAAAVVARARRLIGPATPAEA